MSDYLATCNSGKLRTDPKAFTALWCKRCQRKDCDLAEWAKLDPMARRQATWREHYFGMPQADTAIPKFAQIAGRDFKDLLHKAVKLEISAQRGDWSVPELEINDGKVVQAPEDTTRQVDEAVRQLTRPQDEPDESDDLPLEEPAPPPEEPAPDPDPDPPVRRPKPVFPVKGGNTPDVGEQMVGGASKPPPPKKAKDPWAPPPKPKHLIVKAGATITFGAGGLGKVSDE